MQQSNFYIIGFSALLTVILGGLLAVAAESLKPLQKRQIELDTKKQILSAVMKTQDVPKTQLEKVYGQRVRAMVVNYNGEVVEKDREGNPIVAEKIKIRDEYKRTDKDRFYPVYKFMSEDTAQGLQAYILPMYGKGLWNDIWGYLAVRTDMNSLMGVSFDHIG